MKKITAFLVAVIFVAGCGPSRANLTDLTRHLLRDSASQDTLIREGFTQVPAYDPGWTRAKLVLLFSKTVQVGGVPAGMFAKLKASDGSFCAHSFSVLSTESTPTMLRDLYTAVAPRLQQANLKARWSPKTKNLPAMALFELPIIESNRVFEATIIRTTTAALVVQMQIVNRDPSCLSALTNTPEKLDRFQKLTAAEARADLDMVQQLTRAGWPLD